MALGLKANWPQFALLVVVNALGGGMVGIERTIVPLIGSDEFGIASTPLAAIDALTFLSGAIVAVVMREPPR